MPIELTGLRGLYRAMMHAGITRYKWRFVRGPATFEAIFIAEDPFELLLGAVGSNFGFTVRVYPGFRIDPLLAPHDFHALCDILQLTRDPRRKFKTSDFFNDLNCAIPQTVNLATGRVRPHDVVRHRRGIDTSDGEFFCGWLDNSRNGKRVQPSNLLKTLAVFGQRVHDTCQARNISSCWTHDADRARDFEPPV